VLRAGRVRHARELEHAGAFSRVPRGQRQEGIHHSQGAGCRRPRARLGGYREAGQGRDHSDGRARHRTHGAREEGADALLAADLRKLMQAFRGGPHDDRDRAVILLGFTGAFRASELVGLNVEQLDFSIEGLRIFVERSKENQAGKGAFVDVPRGDNPVTCAVHAVSSWIGRVGRPSGPLFRVIRGTVVEHQRMHVGAVSRAVQRAAARAGLSGDYSAHSLRSGLATSSYIAGHSIGSIQRHGRWLHRRSVERYCQLAHVYGAENPARGLL
jgi:integrase